MIALLAERPTEIELFRAAPWADQTTFHTPLQDLERFTECVLAQFDSESAVFSPDVIVFEPRELLELASSASILIENQWQFILRADGKQDAVKLLSAALGDWVDFLFIPSPESFAIYADHDEFTTFYTREPGKLSSLANSLEQAGFKRVTDYVRGGPDQRWR